MVVSSIPTQKHTNTAMIVLCSVVIATVGMAVGVHMAEGRLREDCLKAVNVGMITGGTISCALVKDLTHEDHPTLAPASHALADAGR